MYKLGVPVKTRHNEVAPSAVRDRPALRERQRRHRPQHADHGDHEADRPTATGWQLPAPREAVRGRQRQSGKHVNWSLSDDLGNNLLRPGDSPHENAQFLIFLAVTLRAVSQATATCSALSVAHAGNDHRLGANEAPPAIISIFLGDMLQDIVDQIEKGGAKSTKAGGTMQIGVSTLPTLPRDAGDRNRTSPFAFTGNKFEFRAVGSSQSIAGPNVVLNTIVAESLDDIATELEAGVKAGKDLNAEIQALLPKLIAESKKVIFNGDGYSEAWHAEAEARGLPNRRNTIDSIPDVISPKAIALFGKYGVLSERELHSRYEIYLENYQKTINIESGLTLQIATRQILPAAIRYQAEVAQALVQLKAAGVTPPKSQVDQLNELTSTIEDLQNRIAALAKVVEDHSGDNSMAHAKHSRDAIIPAMNAVRAAGDKLEGIVADDLWPLPTYQEMLFIK